MWVWVSVNVGVDVGKGVGVGVGKGVCELGVGGWMCDSFLCFRGRKGNACTLQRTAQTLQLPCYITIWPPPMMHC